MYYALIIHASPKISSAIFSPSISITRNHPDQQTLLPAAETKNHTPSSQRKETHLSHLQIVACGWPGGKSGKAEASAIRKLDTPNTLPVESATAMGSFAWPILPNEKGSYKL